MRNTLLAMAFAITLTASPAILFAQDSGAAANPPQGGAVLAPPPNGTTTITITQTTTTSTPQSVKGTGAGQNLALTTKQKTVYATWPDQRRSDYGAWPIDYQTYYWTLTPRQQERYWALTNEQRDRIGKAAPEQRRAVWTSMQQAPTPAAARNYPVCSRTVTDNCRNRAGN